MVTHKVTEGRLIFTFPCLTFEKADEPQTNGLGGVDFVVELEDMFLFIEVKDIQNPKTPQSEIDRWKTKLNHSKDNPFLIEVGGKFKDTIIRRWGREMTFDKPIYYIVLLEFDELDSRLKTKLTSDLAGQLPTSVNRIDGFVRNIKIRGREVLNISDWREKYSIFPIEVSCD